MAQQQRLLDLASQSEASAEPVRQAEHQIRNLELTSGITEAAPDEGAWLDLLLPDALPAEIALDPTDRRTMYELLSGLLEALDLSHAERLPVVEALLQRASPTRITPAEIAISGIPLTTLQAIDYDRYFRVNRHASEEPALSMVRSLLQTVLAVTRLFSRAGDLSEVRVRQQIEGFATQTRLLGRTFGLEALR